MMFVSTRGFYRLILAKLFPVISMWEVAEEQGIDKEYLSEKTNSQ